MRLAHSSSIFGRRWPFRECSSRVEGARKGAGVCKFHRAYMPARAGGILAAWKGESRAKAKKCEESHSCFPERTGDRGEFPFQVPRYHTWGAPTR